MTAFAAFSTAGCEAATAPRQSPLPKDPSAPGGEAGGMKAEMEEVIVELYVLQPDGEYVCVPI